MLKIMRRVGEILVLGDVEVMVNKTGSRWARLVVKAPRGTCIEPREQVKAKGAFEYSRVFLPVDAQATIAGDVQIAVTKVDCKQVSLGITAPREVFIFRKELLERIGDEAEGTTRRSGQARDEALDSGQR